MTKPADHVLSSISPMFTHAMSYVMLNGVDCGQLDVWIELEIAIRIEIGRQLSGRKHAGR